ncbi:NtaA/DmoA family FMN-dependent monooxygenase [Nocardia sp. NPDC003482]
MTARTMHLNILLAASGHHAGAWLLPEADIDANSTVTHYISQAQTAEDAAVDSIFIADSLALGAEARYSERRPFEPLTLAAAIATHTTRIGLIATASTSFTQPYNLARTFASLDHISGGRAGWNIVTTAEDAAARNFGGWPVPDHDTRYDRADEFVGVVRKLWDSWQPGALRRDRTTGDYTDPDKIHAIDHRGTHFDVHGALNIAPGPQRHPVLAQAGSSPRGQQFAGRHAEIVFSVHQSRAASQRHNRAVRAATRAAGRDGDSIRILPGIVPIIAESTAQAHALKTRLDDAVPPARMIAFLEERLGIPLSGTDLDGPVPPLPDAADFPGQQGRFQVIKDLATRCRSIRELYNGLAAGRGHATVVGTPNDVADHMQSWFETGAADGFTVLLPTLPGSSDRFFTDLLPILRRRRLIRTTYDTHPAPALSTPPTDITETPPFDTPAP